VIRGADDTASTLPNVYVVCLAWAVGTMLGGEVEVMAQNLAERALQLMVPELGRESYWGRNKVQFYDYY
jgi:hypothetical protein